MSPSKKARISLYKTMLKELDTMPFEEFIKFYPNASNTINSKEEYKQVILNILNACKSR